MEPIQQLPRAYDEVVTFFANGPSREQIADFRLSDETVLPVRDLLQKNSAGTLTEAESDELDQCVQLDQLMMLIRSCARRDKQINKTA
jgi:hypothetical protein